jgi:hypothetical protein
MLASCKKEAETRDDSELRDRYFRLQEIGWKSRTYTQKADDIIFTAVEVPIQYFLLKDKGSEDLFTIDSLYEQNKTERIIEFNFMQDEQKDLMTKAFTGLELTESVKYMSFAIDRDFYVVNSKNDTIACSGVNYERSYKVSPNQRILLFFSGIQPDEKIQLVYKDHLFRKGTLKFKFKETYKEIAL